MSGALTIRARCRGWLVRTLVSVGCSSRPRGVAEATKSESMVVKLGNDWMANKMSSASLRFMSSDMSAAPNVMPWLRRCQSWKSGAGTSCNNALNNSDLKGSLLCSG
eukprot:4836520-Pyramimonas_sp.AAC.1